MEDIILIAVLAVIVGLAGLYIYRQKKKGSKCIGCPYGCSCSKNAENSGCGGNCSGCKHN